MEWKTFAVTGGNDNGQKSITLSVTLKLEFKKGENPDKTNCKNKYKAKHEKEKVSFVVL